MALLRGQKLAWLLDVVFQTDVVLSTLGAEGVVDKGRLE